MRAARLVTRALTLAAVAWLAACGDAPTTPGPFEDVTLRIVGGDGQRTLAGWTLESPIIVQALDGAGAGVADVLLRFQADGSTSLPVVSTSGAGLATVTWTLDAGSPGQRTLTASIADGDASVTLSATALGPDEAETVIVRGATPSLRGFVLARPDPLDRSLGVVGSRSTPDTVFHLPPQDAFGAELVVFGHENRPAAVRPAWSPGVDTVHVELLPPVAIDIRFVVQAGDFEARKRVMEAQLAATAGVFRDEAMGIVLGDVTFVDDTEPARTVDIDSSQGICSGGVQEGAIKVDLVSSINSGRWSGWGCWNGQIYLAIGTDRFPNLLAHELGHAFTLEHTPTGLMFANQPGTALAEGEIFRAHFHAQSSLNRIFGGQPFSVQRHCHAQPSPCLPEGLHLGTGVIALADRRGPLDAGHGIGPAVDENPPVDLRPGRRGR